jgi:hypothetical protein
VNLLASDEFWDPHAIAGLLKTFLRELPASILTRDLHLKFLSVIGTIDNYCKRGCSGVSDASLYRFCRSARTDKGALSTHCVTPHRKLQPSSSLNGSLDPDCPECWRQ